MSLNRKGVEISENWIYTEEVTDAIKSCKNEYVGTDQKTAEMLKCGGELVSNKC